MIWKGIPVAFKVLATLAALAVSTTVAAGDTWLIADNSSVNDRDMLWLSVVTGRVFPVSDTVTDSARAASFVDRCGAVIRPITGYAPQDRGLSIREPIVGIGTHVIGWAARPILRLHDVGAMEADGQVIVCETDPPVLERCTQYAKTVVEVHPHDPGDEGYAVPLGHGLELVPASHPSHWEAGSQVRVHVLLDGHRWADVPVWAGHEGLDEQAYVWQGRTDRDGIARIPLTRAGHWFIKAQLIRPTNGLERAQREVLECTFTFRARGQSDVNNALRAIRAAHGALDPWAVAGYRMGHRALTELQVCRGSADLRVVQRMPVEAPRGAVADGIRAATGASPVWLDIDPEAAPAEALQTVFTNQATGGSVVMNLRDGFVSVLAGVPSAEREASALISSTLTDEEMFETAPASIPSLAAGLSGTPAGIVQFYRAGSPSTWASR